MGNDIHVQCTRCRNKHLKSERELVLTAMSGVAISTFVCPRCCCRNFYDLTPQVAWCWASGLIEIGDKPPADNENGGPIVIATGPKSFLASHLDVVARHGKGASAGKLLVPGVPEASDQDAAADALSSWLDWCAKGKRNRRYGITFSTAAKEE